MDLLRYNLVPISLATQFINGTDIDMAGCPVPPSAYRCTSPTVSLIYSGDGYSTYDYNLSSFTGNLC